MRNEDNERVISASSAMKPCPTRADTVRMFKHTMTIMFRVTPLPRILIPPIPTMKADELSAFPVDGWY